MDTGLDHDPPVKWDASLGGWTVASYELVKLGLQQPERFTSEDNEIAKNLAGSAMLVIDSPVHDAVRALWTKPFSAPAVAARRAEFEKLAKDILAPAMARLSEGAIIDLVPLFEAFTGKVVINLLQCSRATDDDFRRWYKLVLASAAFSIEPDQPLYRERAEAKAEIYAMLEAEVEARLTQAEHDGARDDLVSLIARAEGCNGITRTVVLDNLFNVFAGGADTTVRWMGNTVVLLNRYPDAMAALRARPALLRPALEEAMRLQSVTRFAVRTVRQDDVVLGGQSMARGDTVYFLTSVANRDPSVFEAPEQFDIYRDCRPHLGFSAGMHKCIGMNLARVEAQAFIGTLLTAAPDFAVVNVDYGDESVVKGPERLLIRQSVNSRP